MVRLWSLVTVLLGVAAGPAGAVTDSNFLARTTADLVDICDPAYGDPLSGYAIVFCQAFAQGAVSVEMQHGAVSDVEMFCLPEPRPKRMETMMEFVRWARAVPERLVLAPEEGLMNFLAQRFPCPGQR